MTARESVDAKALRYLTEGRLVVTYLVGDAVTAVCMGGSGAWDLGHTPGRGWFCSCPVRTDDCCHLRALWLVSIRKRRTGQSSSPAESQDRAARTLRRRSA